MVSPEFTRLVAAADREARALVALAWRSVARYWRSVRTAALSAVSGRGLGRGGSLLVVLASVSACVHLDTSLSGQLIDAESGKPIKDAAVALERDVSCSKLVQSDTASLTPRETRSAADGRFSIGGFPSIAPCIFAFDWTESVRILAPGYFEERFLSTDRPGGESDFGQAPNFGIPPLSALTRSSPFALDPWRYRAEALAYQPLQGAHTDATTKHAGPILRQTIETIRSIGVRPLGPSGVFIADPGAAFDRIAVASLTSDRRRYRSSMVLVRDTNRGLIRAFDRQGAPLDVPLPVLPSAALAASTRRQGYPTLVAPDRIYYARLLDPRLPLLGVTLADWDSIPAERAPVVMAAQTASVLMTVEDGGERLGVYRVGREPKSGGLRSWIGPLSDQTVTDLLPSARPPCECLAADPLNDAFFIIVPVGGSRALFQVNWLPPTYTQSSVRRLDLPWGVRDSRSKITACAAGWRAFFVALENGSVHKLSKPGSGGVTDGAVWSAARLAPGAGVHHFVGMAVSQLEVGLHEVVYAVGGTNAVYRFTSDGVPDQRVEFVIPAQAR